MQYAFYKETKIHIFEMRLNIAYYEPPKMTNKNIEIF